MLGVAAAGPLCVGIATTAFATPPRYLLQPVSGSVHQCTSGQAPWHVHFLMADGRVAGESYCGQVAYGSEPFVWHPDGTVVEYQRGDFDYTQPLALLPDGRMIIAGDWCPPQTGPCTSATAIASASAAPVVLGTASTAILAYDRSDSGWAVGFGAADGSNAWRSTPAGAVEFLGITEGWGESVEAVNESGQAVGNSYVNNQYRGLRWEANGSYTLLTPAEPGTGTTGLDVAIDGTVVGGSNGRAAWWPSGALTTAAVPLLPIGSNSWATHIAGNPSSAGPLGWEIFGALQSGTKLFHATSGQAAQEITLPAGSFIGIEVIDAPRADFMVAQAHTDVYAPVPMVWSLANGLVKFESLVVNPATLPPFSGYRAIDANAAGNILLSIGFDGQPYVAKLLAPGDVNGDDIVNGVDLGAVLSRWGQSTGGIRAAEDFDGDDLIGASDLAIVLANWS